MAAKIVGLLFLTSLLAICSSQEGSVEKENSEPSCEEVCENTYPLHTYEKASHVGCCKRGCRLFSIIDFTEEFPEVNATRDSCQLSCKDAYTDDERDACNLGCNSQRPCFANRLSEMDEMFPPPQLEMFSPLLYVHDMYSNMFSKLHRTMSVSWTFYMQGDNGQLVVIKSATPRLIQLPMDDGGEEYKTSNYLESNLEALDNSATPNLNQHSQVHGALSQRDLGGLMGSRGTVSMEEQPNDFLGCIARKTGLPKLLLSVTIFLSALVMIWLCISSAVTAPDQHVRSTQPPPPPPPPQKLSIYGDLEYLLETSEADKAWILAAVHHQPTKAAASSSSSSSSPSPSPHQQAASALPIKIPVNTV